MKTEDYDILIGREAAHWSAGPRSGDNPQIWDDGKLFEIFYGREYRRLLDQAQERGPRVLELGCGSGGTALALAERGLHVTGIDLSPERIASAAREAGRRGLAGRTTFLTGDLNVIPLPASAFDCVVAHDALHHILELGDLLDRVRRALVPGGRLIVMDFVGMGKSRRVCAAAMFALLPTYRSYRTKWSLRRRLLSFLTSEKGKRRALAEGTAELLHAESPFEEISGPSIRAEIQARFRVGEYFTFCPFWYYLAPKLRLPRALRYPVARTFHALDEAMIRIRPGAGAHIFMTAYND
jgi:ubiquinone/menaquinone biosynthesis C-methylase UbiE